MAVQAGLIERLRLAADASFSKTLVRPNRVNDRDFIHETILDFSGFVGMFWLVL